MPTQIETTNQTAIHARLETLSELLDTLSDRLYRSYDVGLPGFRCIGLDRSEDWFRLEIPLQPVTSAEIQCNMVTGAVRWHEFLAEAYEIEPCDRAINIDSDADWDWINARVRKLLEVIAE